MVQKKSQSKMVDGLHDLQFRRSKADSKYVPKQLKMGVKVEQEHTRSKRVAKVIAKHHLDEIPDYYTRLNKMEKQARKELQKKAPPK